MIGPTGVGQNRDCAPPGSPGALPVSQRSKPPKFTEVGYVGRDVESMIRDLVELGKSMVQQEEMERVRARAAERRRGACWTCCCRILPSRL